MSVLGLRPHVLAHMHACLVPLHPQHLACGEASEIRASPVGEETVKRRGCIRDPRWRGWLSSKSLYLVPECYKRVHARPCTRTGNARNVPSCRRKGSARNQHSSPNLKRPVSAGSARRHLQTPPSRLASRAVFRGRPARCCRSCGGAVSLVAASERQGPTPPTIVNSSRLHHTAPPTAPPFSFVAQTHDQLPPPLATYLTSFLPTPSFLSPRVKHRRSFPTYCPSFLPSSSPPAVCTFRW